MKEEKKKEKTIPKNIPNDPYGCDTPDKLDIKASATDCTGLIPSLPADDAELASYAQIYHYASDILEE